MFYTTFVKLTFSYKNNIRLPLEIEVTIKEFKPIIQRIADKKGILVIKEKKIDLTIIEKVIIEFSMDLAVK